MSWDDIVGHEPAIRLLKGQLAKGQVAQTVLFAGARGIGKRALALEFARALECDRGGGDGAASDSRSREQETKRSARIQEACGACEPCRKISAGSFPDLKVISPESETGQITIDQVRELINWMSLSPYEGRWKIGLVERAEQMTEEAANAGLKLLEEPPPKSILLLTATAPHRLASTLLSRCHVVRCAPQGIPRVMEHLQKKEGLGPEQARVLASWSGGRLGMALEFHKNNRLAEKNEALDQILTAVRQKAVEIPLGSGSRLEVEEALEWAAAWWRDLLLLSVEGDSSWVIHQDRLKELQQAKSTWDVEHLLRQVERTYRAQEAVQRNASPRIALAALLSRSS